MPIRQHLKGFYPFDWKQLSAVIRFERAKGDCEDCGRPHGATVQHVGNGVWLDERRGHWRDGRGRKLSRFTPPAGLAVRFTKVVLATAHLDHDPTNNPGRNLKALCQRCHMLHDQAEHQRQRLLTLRRRKAIGDLFSGPYRP